MTVTAADDAHPPVARGDRGVPRPAAGRPTRRRSSRCRRAAPRWCRRRQLSRAHRLRGAPQGRGRQPDRLVQGPRHDHGHLARPSRRARKAVICASTGNTSASAAAYAARAGLICAVLVPQGKIAIGKLAQALVHGAKLLQVDGNFDDCLDARPQARRSTTRSRWSTASTRTASRGRRPRRSRSSTPSGDAPDVHCLPVGNAGNITAYWKGYREYAADGRRHPHARGCAASRPPVPRRSSPGARSHEPADDRHRDPHRQPGVVDQGAGRARRVRRPRSTRSPTEQILAAYRLLARSEGVFVEPASAASRRRAAAGRTRPGALAAGPAGRLHGHRPRAQGPGVGDLAARRRRVDRSRSTPPPPPRSSGCWPDRCRRRVPGRPGARPGAGDQREPRPGLRLRSGWPWPVRRPRRRGHRRRASASTSPARAPASCPPTSRTSSCGRSAPPSRELGWAAAAACACRCAQPHPARPRAGLVGGRDRRRRRWRPGRCRPAVDRRRRRRGAAAGRPSSRATRTTSRLPARRADAVAWTDGDGRARPSGSTVDPRVAPVVLVPDATGCRRTWPAACCPTSVPHADAAANAGRAALLVARADRATRPAARRPPRTGCTSARGRRRCRESLALRRPAARAPGHAAVVSGAGPSVLVLALGRPTSRRRPGGRRGRALAASTPDGLARAAAARSTRAGAARCWSALVTTRIVLSSGNDAADATGVVTS